MTQAMSIDRQRPQATDVERAVLSACMIGGLEAVEKAREAGVVPETFYHTKHRHIYAAICVLCDNSVEADLNSVVEELTKKDKLDTVGGPAMVAEIAAEMATAAHLENHCQIILDKAERRGFISRSEQIISEAHDESVDIEEIRANASRLVVEKESGRRYVFRAGETAMMALDHLKWQMQNPDVLPGISTGYDDLDDKTLGFWDGDMILIAGRPSHGKTALTNCIVTNMSIDQGKPGLYASAEMSELPQGQRLLSIRSKVPLQRIRRGNVSRDELMRLEYAAKEIANAPLFMVHGLTDWDHIARIIRKYKREEDIAFCAVDYLQFLTSKLGKREGGDSKRHEEVAHMSRGAKSLAQDLGIPLIACAQLNRNNTGKMDKRPQLSDLRESGQLEQDADVVMFVHRPAMYGDTYDEEAGRDLTNLGEIIIGKQRNGPIGTVETVFDADTGRFLPMTTYHDDPYPISQETPPEGPAPAFSGKGYYHEDF